MKVYVVSLVSSEDDFESPPDIRVFKDAAKAMTYVRTEFMASFGEPIRYSDYVMLPRETGEILVVGTNNPEYTEIWSVVEKEVE